MTKKISKLNLFVDSLEDAVINENDQALMLMGGYGDDGVNDGCTNSGDCTGSSNVDCTNSGTCG